MKNLSEIKNKIFRQELRNIEFCMTDAIKRGEIKAKINPISGRAIAELTNNGYEFDIIDDNTVEINLE